MIVLHFKYISMSVRDKKFIFFAIYELIIYFIKFGDE